MTLKAAIVIVGATTMSSLLVARGIYTLWTGKVFLPPRARPKPLRQRLSPALLYLIGGGFIAFVLVRALVRSGRAGDLARWAAGNGVVLILPLVALYFIVRPSSFVNWLHAQAPEAEFDERTMLAILRYLGVIGLFVVCISLLRY